MRDTRLGYMPALDGLRALAISLVVAYHAVPGFTFGMIGVDVFFVLSGFLITALIAGQIHSDTFARRRFYARRAVRLVPALLVMVVVFTPPALAVMTGEPVLIGAVAALFYASPFVPITIFSHTWTLAFEEWFYLLWPLALAKFFRDHLTLRQAAGVAGSIALAVQLAMLTAPQSLIARPSALLAGSALALWWLDGGRIRHPSLALTSGIGLILLGAVAGPALYGPLPFWLAVLGAILAVGAVASDGGGIALQVLQLGPMVAVGVVSYEWYLLHAPMLSLAEKLWGNESFLAVVPASLLAAFALHHALAPLQAQMRRRLDDSSVDGVSATPAS